MAKRAAFFSFCLALLALSLAIISCRIGAGASEPDNASAPAGPTTAAASEKIPTPTAKSGEAAPAATQPAAAQPASPSVQESAPCGEETCVVDGNFLLSRPVGEGGRKEIDHSNRFGSYQKQTREAHFGVDFLNSTGAPVVAAAAGKVVVAGDDSKKVYALRPNTYGNVVIIQHQLAGISEPVYTLYAHLSEILVKVDEQVDAGQEIGKVGMSGSVKGSTLHFEVRLGNNSYEAVRNPELWLEPLPDDEGQLTGALAGTVLDAKGDPVEIKNIVLEQLAGPGLPAIDQFYTKTYSDKRLLGLEPLGETFAIAGLPAGSYQISFLFHNQMQQRIVELDPGKLVYVTFQMPK